jgi:hypothetical protein
MLFKNKMKNQTCTCCGNPIKDSDDVEFCLKCRSDLDELDDSEQQITVEEDFLDEIIAERTVVNPNFPQLVEEAAEKRKNER